MEELKILEDLFDTKIISILKVFFRNGNKEHYLQEVSDKSKVSMASCSRILTKLEKLEIIEIKMVSRFKLYKISDNNKAKFLSKLFKEDLKIMQKFAEHASKIEGVKTIILHGKEQKDRANVLLIGENINPGDVKALCAKIKEEEKFSISPLALTAEQYTQMSQMGLYSGTKKILWEAK
jgi:DNA-binding Lrp family transcriptional regulator